MTNTWQQIVLFRTSLGITTHWLKFCISFLSNPSFYLQHTLNSLPIDNTLNFNLNPDFDTVLPSKRKALMVVCTPFSPLVPLLYRIDKLPDAREHINFALHLPMFDNLHFPSTLSELHVKPQSLKGSVVSNFFYYDNRYKRLTRIQQHAPQSTVARKLQNYLMQNEILLHPFFLKLLFPSTSTPTLEVSSSTFTTFLHNTIKIPLITTHLFRQELLSNIPLPRHTVSRITKRSWKYFCQSKMSFRLFCQYIS